MQKDCAATTGTGTVEGLWHCHSCRYNRYRTATAGTVEGLWHCGRKLQQSLSGGQAAVSCGTVPWEEAAAEPFGGAGGSLGTVQIPEHRILIVIKKSCLILILKKTMFKN